MQVFIFFKVKSFVDYYRLVKGFLIPLYTIYNYSLLLILPRLFDNMKYHYCLLHVASSLHDKP